MWIFHVVFARNYYTVHEKYGNTTLFLSPTLSIVLSNLVADVSVLNDYISPQQSDTFFYKIEDRQIIQYPTSGDRTAGTNGTIQNVSTLSLLNK